MSDKEARFRAVFDDLKRILARHASQLTVVHDTDDNFYLDAANNPQNPKKPLYFGSVTIKKNYVSYYLMPVYLQPDLLAHASEALKKRMQGKSCFNFKTQDAALFAELADLTQRGLEAYAEAGYLAKPGA